MSERDPPSPGRDNRTIVRPNPGGRRPTPPPGQTPNWTPGPPAAPTWNPGPTPLPDWSQPARPASPVAPTPGGGAPYPAWPNAGRTEDWIASSAPAPVAPPAPLAPPSSIDELFAPNANPLLRAASPVLLLLGRLRASLVAARIAALLDQVALAIKRFDVEARRAGVPEEHVTRAKYIVCATADDIVQNIPADDRHEYARYSMLASFFGTRDGGLRFFDLVEQDKADPMANYALLELEHTCLALGFQGRYRAEGGGAAVLQHLQRNIYETLRRVRPRTARDLSPRWRGQHLPNRASGLRVPVWAVSATAAVLVLGLYFVFRYLLSGGAEAASAATLALTPTTPIEITRKVYAPPPPPPPRTPTQLTQLQRIRAALAPEIAAGTVSVPNPTGPKWIVINVGSLLLFNSGEATVIDRFKPLADRIRAMLEGEKGAIGVVGHTDNTPLGPTNAFKSNFDLSVARAKSVGAILQQGFSQPARFKVDGKGSDQPIADNKTEVGRKQNRRVEILVEQTD